VDALERRGHRALTADVPRVVAASSAEYAELLAELPPADLYRPVIAAHSAVGLLLPALADRLDATHQVWLAAAVTDYAGGRSLITEIRADPTAVFHDEWVGVDPTGDPVLATYFLFHDADLPDSASDPAHRLGLRPVRGLRRDPQHRPAARPSTYLLPVADLALTHAWMSRVARDRLHSISSRSRSPVGTTTTSPTPNRSPTPSNRPRERQRTPTHPS
jgi:hypothetical protein